VTRRGRPRNARLDERIVERSLEVLTERGYSGFTIRDVAGRVGVPRSTVYARWPHAAALLDEVVGRSLARPAVFTGDPRADLAGLLEADVAWMQTAVGRAGARLLIESVEPGGYAPARTTSGIADRRHVYTRCVGDAADVAILRRLEVVVASLWAHTARAADREVDLLELVTLVLGEGTAEEAPTTTAT
jgi:AcrR family transcriptional regulator